MEPVHSYIITSSGIPIGEIKARSNYEAKDKYINLASSRGLLLERTFIKAVKK